MQVKGKYCGLFSSPILACYCLFHLIGANNLLYFKPLPYCYGILRSNKNNSGM